jgi:hypothetical protein
MGRAEKQPVLIEEVEGEVRQSQEGERDQAEAK